MHTLHLISICADSAEDACDEVEALIIDFGYDNNWRTICGAISEDNEVYIHDEDGTFPPSEDMTISDVQNLIQSWANNFNYDPTEALVKFKMAEETLSIYEWEIIEKYAEHHKELLDLQQQSQDIWQCNFREWQLDENGLTNHLQTYEGGKRYIVFIDMHS